MILRNDADQISLSVLDEIHLIVHLCSAVFPSVPKSELVSGEPLSSCVILFNLFTGFWEQRVRWRAHRNSEFGSAMYRNESLVT
jgi:hypothetical protein